MSNAIAAQLDLLGFDETRRLAAIDTPHPSARSRRLRRIDATHAMCTEIADSNDDIAFLHAGLCQSGCGLPHSRPKNDDAIWQRSAGRFYILVNPGSVVDQITSKPRRVGVPYGPRARLIMIHLQTEGMRSRTVNLGASMSQFLRSLGQPISGGPRGTTTAVREQCLRIARCSFTLQWSNDGFSQTIIRESRIVDGLELWQVSRDDWSGEVHLSKEFHAHLQEHAVPLSKQGIALLAGNSFGLDMYALFAHRLHRLNKPFQLNWRNLREQVGSDIQDPSNFSRRVREVLPDVTFAYPEARIEVNSRGLLLYPSRAPVTKKLVQVMTPEATLETAPTASASETTANRPSRQSE
jgi:hypothetical protein